MKTKMYIVKYSIGEHGDCARFNLFVTSSKKTADDFANKANRVLMKAKSHYSKMYGELTFGVQDTNFSANRYATICRRYWLTESYGRFYVEEVEFRP